MTDPWKRTTAHAVSDVVDVRTRNGHREYRIHRTHSNPDSDKWTREAPPELVAAFEERTRLLDQIQTPYVIIDHREHRSGRHYRVTFGDGRKDRWISHNEADKTAVEDYDMGNTFTVFTDHESIRDVLHSAPRVDFSKRIDKYRMLLQPYLDDMEIVYRPGKKMVMVDPLSRAKYLDDDAQECVNGKGAAPEKNRDTEVANGRETKVS
ncbi:hypothetical protein FN846DRAFT_909451 [Sphaerosporella brunnea]|uniref:Chromo domain-containing protein n=1 Tax=Sphaerosporella brunnea TaxID=1250544 RepID=A0A5J5ER09_9PEZI|nr:hypothetical protein FN846DRAFT_909451 [Sphaerosporella brunnea]